MTVHLARRPASDAEASAPRVGFVVSKAVGNAVERNRTQRQLRHLVAQDLGRVPERTDLVIRAHPASRAASSVQLDAELDRLLTKALRGLEQSGSGS